MIKGTFKVYKKLISGNVYDIQHESKHGTNIGSYRYMGVKQDYHIFVNVSGSVVEFFTDGFCPDSLGFSEDGEEYKLIAETFDLNWSLCSEGNNIKFKFTLPNGKIVEDSNDINDWIFSLMKFDENYCESLEV